MKKGIFRELNIKSSKKIEIGEGAFAATYDKDKHGANEQKEIEKVTSRISAIYINEYVETIGIGSFKDCCSLISVKTNALTSQEGLKEIKPYAFSGCSKFASADFIESKNLTKIGKEAFGLCYKLNKLEISNKIGWKTSDDFYRFAASDLNSTNFIELLVHLCHDREFVVEENNLGSVYAYHPDDKLQSGIHHNAINVTSLEEISNNTYVKDGSYVHLTKNYAVNESSSEITIKNGHSVYIQADEDLASVTINKLIIEPKAYVILGPRIHIGNGGVKLEIQDDQQGVGGEIGGVAFAYTSQEQAYPAVTIGVNDKVARGASATITLDGEDKVCTAYGLSYYREQDTQFALNNLSHLGKQCKGLELNNQQADAGSNITIINSDFSKNNNVIENLTIGDTIEYPSTGVFIGCTNLKTLKIGARFKYFHDESFNDCTKLQSIDMGTNTELETICGFKNCKSLNKVVIGDNNTKLKYKHRGTFEHAPITYFKMPTNLTSGWHTNTGKTFTQEEMSDPVTCAKAIRDYCEAQWYRN